MSQSSGPDAAAQAFVAYQPDLPPLQGSPLIQTAECLVWGLLPILVPGSCPIPGSPAYADIFFPDYPFGECNCLPSLPNASTVYSLAFNNLGILSFPYVNFQAPMFTAAQGCAVIAAGIYGHTSATCRCIDETAVASAMAGVQESLDLSIRFQALALTLCADFMTNVADRASWTLLNEHPHAVQSSYLQILKSKEWITLCKAKAASGHWNNADWELYLHYAKLYSLGASQQTIDELILFWSSPSVNLPIPPTVQLLTWPGYDRWQTPALLKASGMPQGTINAMQQTVDFAQSPQQAALGNLPEGFSVAFICMTGAPGAAFYIGQPWGQS
jgi:hypothetical protein